MAVTVKINLGANDAAKKVDMWGEFKGTIKEIQEEMPDIEKKALNVGAYILKQALKEEIIVRWPAAGRPFRPRTGGYATSTKPIAESGTRQSKVNAGKTKVIAGLGARSEAGYLLKMYEHDSRPRYQKSIKGKPLSRPRYIGKLTGLNYFDPGIRSGEEEAYEAMERIIFSRIEQIFDDEKN